MAADELDWELVGDKSSTIWSNLSWNSQITRTRVVTEKSLTSNGGGNVRSLTDILQVVQKLNLPKYNYDHFEESTSIGEGESFHVERSTYEGKAVAVKHLKTQEHRDEDGEKKISRRLAAVFLEIRIMEHTPLKNHPYILSILGYGWSALQNSIHPYLVVELGDLGVLRKYLRKKIIPLTSKKILCGDVAAGLMALHSCQIVHGDLKLENVVVFSSWDRPSGAIAKICDFGHSILPFTEKGTPKYYGTPLYNPPEAFHQRDVPIEKEDMHKCDIWAYGLLVWEILKDGEIFFDRSWRRDSRYSKKSVESTSSVQMTQGTSLQSVNTETTLLEPADDPEADYVFVDGDEESVHGHFDLARLKQIAQDFVTKLHGHRIITSFDKGYLKPLLGKCLSLNPADRMSNLFKTPLMTSWNAEGAGAVRAALAIHTGSSELTFDIFRTDTGESIEWVHQQQMLNDLESMLGRSKPGKHTTAVSQAAFQAAICYINRFGTVVNTSKATKFLERAYENGHPMSPLLSRLIELMSPQNPSRSIPSFSKTISEILNSDRVWNNHYDDSLFSFDPEIDVAHLPFPGDKTFVTWLKRIWQSKSNPELKVTQRKGPCKESLSLLELAIAFEQYDMVAETASDLNTPGAFGETLIIQAARTGNAEIVNVLAKKGADLNIPAADGSTILHWLFYLEDHITTLMPLLKHKISPELVEQISTPVRKIHSQWPLRLNGSPLSFAVTAGSYETVKALLELGADPLSPAYSPNVQAESHDGKALTPLHLALKYQMNDIWKLLIQHISSGVRGGSTLIKQQFRKLNISVKLQDPCHCMSNVSTSESGVDKTNEIGQYFGSDLYGILGGATPIERLAIHGRGSSDNLEDILSTMPFASLKIPAPNGQTVLMQAIENNEIAVVGSLLNVYPELARESFQDPADDKIHTTPLHFACQIGSLRDAEDAIDVASLILLQNRNGLLSTDDMERSCLHLSVTGPYARLTHWILKTADVDVNCKDSMGRTPLHLCGSVDNLKAILDANAKLDVTNKDSLTPLQVKALFGQADQISELISRGADINFSSNPVGTALHCAVRKSARPSVSLLIAKGASLDLLDSRNQTALHLAAKIGRLDIVKMLLEAYSPLDIEDSNHYTCLDIALLNERQAIVQAITKASIDRDLPQERLIKSIHNSCAWGQVKSLEALLTTARDSNKPIDLNYLIKGRTALDIAASSCNATAASIFLRFGADPNHVNPLGQRPLHLAINSNSNSNKDTVPIDPEDRLRFFETMVGHGASLEEPDSSGFARLWDLALIAEDFELMDFLIKRDAGPREEGGFRVADNAMAKARKGEHWEFITTVIKHGYCDVFGFFGRRSESTVAAKVFARWGRAYMVRYVFEREVLRFEARKNSEREKGYSEMMGIIWSDYTTYDALRVLGFGDSDIFDIYPHMMSGRPSTR